MSMWKKLRKEYTDYTLEDVGKILGITKQAVNMFENGKSKVPIKMQILYLGFRNDEIDQVIIEYLKEMSE